MENSKQAAFPRPWSKNKQSPNAPEQISIAQSGLTKREYFAAMAMQSFAQHAVAETFESVAKSAVKMADELLKQLEK